MTPTSRVHFPLAHTHQNHCPAEQLTTNSNRSSLPHALNCLVQMEGLEPHTGAFEGQNRVCCSPTWGCTCGFVLESGQEEWGGKEKALVHSHAWPGMRLRCAPTCPLCSPKSPPAQMCGNLDLWNRIYGNCTSQSHAFNKNIACIFSGVKVKQVPPHLYSI